MFFEAPELPGRIKMRLRWLKMTPRWPQDGLKLGQDELRWVNLGMRWPTMGNMCDKI